MKRFTSLLLALVMVLSVLSTFVVFTSAAGNQLEKTYDAAADGDILYKALFGQTEGVYQSKIIKVGNAQLETDPTTFQATPSADGSEVTLTFTPPDTNSDGKSDGTQLWYGGAVEGLEWGSGQKYTIEYKIHFANDAANIQPNAGVYFNYPTSFESDKPFERTETDYLLGWYGTPNTRSTLAIGGSKYTGKFISHSRDYITNYTFAPTDGYNTVAIEVDDDNFKVYIDGTFFDEGSIYDTQVAKAKYIGLTIYLYNNQVDAGDTFKVKDVVIRKGHMLNLVSKKPDYYKEDSTTESTNVLLKTYDAAADGDLLYTLKMNATDGVFAPKVLEEDQATTVTTTDNELTLLNMGTAGAHWWGGIIDGLEVTEDTKYTMSLKVKNITKGNAGFSFLTPRGQRINSAFNWYGMFTPVEATSTIASLVIQRGSSKINGEILQAGSSYTPIYPILDENGYADVMVEIDGFKISYYYRSDVNGLDTVDPYWALFEYCDARAVITSGTETTDYLAAYDKAEICFITYIYNVDSSAAFKDVNIYKGLTVEKPEATTDEPTTDAPTTEEVTTDAPTTDAATTETPAGNASTTDAATTEAPKGGCGSIVGGGIAVVAIVALGAIAVSKKKN